MQIRREKCIAEQQQRDMEQTMASSGANNNAATATHTVTISLVFPLD